MAHATSEEEVEEYDREKLGEELEYDFWDLLRARDKAKKSLKKYEEQLLQLVLSGVPLERAPPADNDKANANAKDDDDEDEDDDDEDDDTVADARAYREDRGKKADKNRDRSRSPCARLSRAQRSKASGNSQKGSRSGSAAASAPSERDQAWARNRTAGYYCG